MGKREQKKEKEKVIEGTDYEKVLGVALENEDTKKYLNKLPTTRHEAWLLITALGVLNLSEEVKKLREILEKRK